MTDLIEIRGLRKDFPIRRGPTQRVTGVARVLDGIDLSIREGEFLAVVGESGSGKSTLGLAVLSLIDPTAGEVLFGGEDLRSLPKSILRKRRRELQMIFQDPVASLNPRMQVGEILTEPLETHNIVPPHERQKRVVELLQEVGAPAGIASAYPHELSGGQRQRIAIARALACEPRFLVADEPVSALDVSLRGQVINLLSDLRDRLGLTILFIAHDLAIVERVSDRVAVMYGGKIVELAPTQRLFREPQHPYSASLLSAIPLRSPDARQTRIVLSGEPPNPSDLPPGCRFHPRCPIVQERCRSEEPAPIEMESGQQVSCHYPGESDLRQGGTTIHGTF